MSRTLEDYRTVQIDIRLLVQMLAQLNDEEKTHPSKVSGNTGTLEEQARWVKLKNGFARRREALKKQLAAKEEQREMLYLNLSQTPLPMVSLADVIDKLTLIEEKFTLDGADCAWDSLTAFIDHLDAEESRVTQLQAVKAA